jgi:hypothetical protein
MDCVAIDQNKTSPANTHLASGMRASQFKCLAQEVRQRVSRRNAAPDRNAVHGQIDLDILAHTASIIRPRRRPVSTRAR